MLLVTIISFYLFFFNIKNFLIFQPNPIIYLNFKQLSWFFLILTDLMCRFFVPYRYIRTQSIVFQTFIHGGIMENFGKYLESERIVSKNWAPFYVAWISQFFKFVDKKINWGNHSGLVWNIHPLSHWYSMMLLTL